MLDRLNPAAARQELAHLDVPALLAAVPADARRGEVDDVLGPVLHGRPPLEPAHGVHLVHFTARRAFHPVRLHRVLTALCRGVVRMRGRVWLASRHDTVMWLEAAGRSLRIGEAGPWPATKSNVDDFALPTACRDTARPALSFPSPGSAGGRHRTATPGYRPSAPSISRR
ncbi:GTP-binding protein [Saccharothrix sp. NPDC042600]|uniref:GTP-binding protein n=1 Tax=Saccharothrix TaxID=2071 RepID=UPI0033F51EDF